ncbi:MAG: hypothetical protein VB051_00895 [Candidatus Pelethousia sp.]|nr:hypothetical protein [Candidatus Pelethousia sp.]
METKKYYAEDMPAAMEQIKRELGADAIIIKSRKIKQKYGPLGLLRKSVYEVVVSCDKNEPLNKRREISAREALSQRLTPPANDAAAKAPLEKAIIERTAEKAAPQESAPPPVQPERFAQLMQKTVRGLVDDEDDDMLRILSAAQAQEQPAAVTPASKLGAYATGAQQPKAPVRPANAAPVPSALVTQASVNAAPLPSALVSHAPAAPIAFGQPAAAQVIPAPASATLSVSDRAPLHGFASASAPDPVMFVQAPAAVEAAMQTPAAQVPAVQAPAAQAPAAHTAPAPAPAQAEAPAAPVKRGRGRPRKYPQTTPASSAQATPAQGEAETLVRLATLEKMILDIRQKLGGQGERQEAQTAAAKARPGSELNLTALLARLEEQDVDQTALTALEAAARLRMEQGENDYQAISGALEQMLGKPRYIRASKNKPRCIMLIGPTGVGKTTTLVKLVSSCIFERGAKVGIINADVFRVGAQDQLGTYANILDVPVTTIYDSREIVEAVAAFSELDFVFIDTSGKAPQDKAYQAELGRLSTLGDIQETYLTVSSATSGRVCRQIVKEYENIGPYRVVVTKLDESGSYGAAVNLCQASGQPLSYITTGQNVPEDICRARVDEIIASLLR